MKSAVIIMIIVFVLVGLSLFLYYSNHYVTVSEYKYVNYKVPAAFRCYKMLQISDLHGDLPDWKSRRLLKLISEQRPDVIFFTGDAIDHIHYKGYDKVVAFTKEIAENYPVYYVTGNHEYMHPECIRIVTEFEKIGVKILKDFSVILDREGDGISLFGVEDPYALYDNIPKKYKTPESEFRKHISEVLEPVEGFSILLSHRPEFFESYVEAGVDLVFAGHAHGGQWWVPLKGGFIAPDQGLFPRYVRGKYHKDQTTMFVSRGLGNSVVPFRLFNRPELIVVTLQGEEYTKR